MVLPLVVVEVEFCNALPPRAWPSLENESQWDLVIRSSDSGYGLDVLVQAVVPRFRLLDGLGVCHGEMDAHYESFDDAWSDALNWWQERGGDLALPCGVGVEVSTRRGRWRTLRHPGSVDIRGLSCPLPRG